MTPFHPKNILIVRLSALGDVINTLPVLHELRQSFPEAKLTWLVEPEAEPIIRAQTSVDATIVVRRKQWQRTLKRPGNWLRLGRDVKECMNRLRSRRFDIGLDFQGNFRSGFLLWLSGAKRRIGFHSRDRKEYDLSFTTEQAPALPGPCHRVEKALHLLRALGIHPGPAQATLPLDAESEKRAKAFMQSKELANAGFVVVHPGTSRFGAYKRWPDEEYVELMRRIVREIGLSVVITWGPEERSQAESLAEKVGLPRVRPCFPTNLLSLAAILKRAELFIGADTGPGHLASLVGTKVVAIFGPKDPAIYRPYFSSCQIVERDLWCRPCISRTCSAPVCLSGIPASKVLKAVEQALVRPRSLRILTSAISSP